MPSIPSSSSAFTLASEFHDLQRKALVARVRALIEAKGLYSADAFNVFDADRTGTISCSELAGALAAGVVAVARVAEQGVADRGEVGADLVGASGLDAELDEAGAGAGAQGADLGVGFAGLVAGVESHGEPPRSPWAVWATGELLSAAECAAWRERDVALLETGDFIFAGGSWGLSRLPTGARRHSSTRMVEDAAFAALETLTFLRADGWQLPNEPAP